MSDEFSEFVSRYDFPRDQVVKYRKLQSLVIISSLSLLPAMIISALITEQYLPVQIWNLTVPSPVGWLIFAIFLVLCFTLVQKKKNAPINSTELVYYEIVKAREAYRKGDLDAFHEHIDEANSGISNTTGAFLEVERELLDTYFDEWKDENRDEDYLLTVFEDIFQQIAEVEEAKRSVQATTEEIESKSENDVEISSLEIVAESFSELPINPHVAAGVGVVVVGAWIALSGINGAVGAITAGLGLVQVIQNQSE